MDFLTLVETCIISGKDRAWGRHSRRNIRGGCCARHARHGGEGVGGGGEGEEGESQEGGCGWGRAPGFSGQEGWGNVSGEVTAAASSQDRAWIGAARPALSREKIFTERMTSDRKLETSRVLRPRGWEWLGERHQKGLRGSRQSRSSRDRCRPEP